MQACSGYQFLGKRYHAWLAFRVTRPPQVRGISYCTVQTVGVRSAYAYAHYSTPIGSFADQLFDGSGKQLQIIVKIVNQRGDHTLFEYGPVLCDDTAL